MRRHRPFGGPSLPGFESFDLPAPDPAPAPPDSTPVRSPISELPFAVKVVRSGRRKTTVGAQLVGQTLTVTVPAWMADVEIERWTEEMSRRFVRKMSTDAIDLTARATALARRYDLPRAREIRWDEMTTRWGSCTMATASIRVSNRLAAFPDWVLDYVIVHELAHLEVPDHSPAFWKVVDRYPKAERAKGYLMAKAGDGQDAD